MNTETIVLPPAVPVAPPAPVEITLTEEQLTAVNRITDFIAKPNAERQFKIGGYAGTGKTTLIKHLLKHSGKRCLVCAFTGKAVHVLNKKGVPAATIHSSIYNTEVNRDGTYTFYRRDRIEGNPDIIIVDEASMVSTDLYDDLLLFGKPIIWVGDPGQLEPVGDNPNLMAEPDFVLSKIHRQAEKSPIISLATKIRMGGVVEAPMCDDLKIYRGKKQSITPQQLLAVDQVLCATNRTRITLNNAVRKHLNRPANDIVIGDKIIVLRNNRTFSVFNGMIATVTKIKKTEALYYMCDLVDELGNELLDRPLWRTPFIRALNKNEYCPRDYVHVDFAYAITVHKSQGSEWDNVLLFDEWLPPKVWDMKRWRYTGITRAAKKLEVYV